MAERHGPDADQSYSVTVNSFLASGGDNFREFAKGTDKRDTGKVDLQAMVDYMAEFANQQATRRCPSTTPGTPSVRLARGRAQGLPDRSEASFRLSSLAMSAPKDDRDRHPSRQARQGVTRTGADGRQRDRHRGSFDDYGKALANASSRSTGTVRTGDQTLTLTGPTTGTTLQVPDQVKKAQPTLTRQGEAEARSSSTRRGRKVKVKVRHRGYRRHGQGKVKVTVGGKTYQAKLDGRQGQDQARRLRQDRQEEGARASTSAPSSTQSTKDIVRIKVRHS